MLPRYLISLSIIIFILSGCSTHNTPGKKSENQFPIQTSETSQNKVKQLDQIATEDQSLISKASVTLEIDNGFFKITYDPSIRLAKLVSYKVKASDLRKETFKRKDAFRVDPYLKAKKLPFATPAEYSNTGYDKGHLAPAGDFSWSAEASDKTFVMSNMAPQLPKLNRDSWKRLEEKERLWACGEGELRILTGPIVSPGYKTLPGGLPIPQQFFKIIIDETPPKKVISFIFNQEDSGNVIEKRLADIKSIEKKVNVNFAKFELPVKESRLPASLNSWKESNCGEAKE